MLLKVSFEGITAGDYRDPEHFYPTQQQPCHSAKDVGLANIIRAQFCTNSSCVLPLLGYLRWHPGLQRGDKCKSTFNFSAS